MVWNTDVKFKMSTKRFRSCVGIQIWDIVQHHLKVQNFYLYENAPLRGNVRFLQSILYSGWLGTALYVTSYHIISISSE
jgi:hypothetical protein